MNLKIISSFLTIAVMGLIPARSFSQGSISDTLLSLRSGKDSLSVSIDKIKDREWTNRDLGWDIVIKKFDSTKRLYSENEYKADSTIVATCLQDPANFNGIRNSSVNYVYDDKNRIKTMTIIIKEPLDDEIEVTRYYDRSDSLKKEVIKRDFMKERKMVFYSYEGNSISEYSKNGSTKANRYKVYGGKPRMIRYHRKQLDRKTVVNDSGKTVSKYKYRYRAYFVLRIRKLIYVEDKMYDRSGNAVGVVLRDKKGKIINPAKLWVPE